MAIVYLLDADGGFTAGDTETRITVYAYPTSLYATVAKRKAAAVAEQMIGAEHRFGFDHEMQYDARNWKRLDA